MPTVIHNTGQQPSENTGTGVVIGILLVVFLAVLFLIFGLPYLRNRGTAQPAAPSANINVELPGGGDTGGGTDSAR